MPPRAARARGRATGRRPGSPPAPCRTRSELQDLVGDQLERGAGAGALEEADRALGRRRRRRRVLEQRPLEVGERRVRVVGVARRQLLDPPGGEPRQVGGRALERREDEPPGLVLQRHGDVHPPGERLEQPPLRAAQVLEAVGVDRPAVPGGEIVREPARRRGRAEGRGPRARAGRALRGIAGRARRGRRRASSGSSNPASSSATAVPSASPNPANRADAPSSPSFAPDTTRRRISERCASPATGFAAAVPGRDPLEDVVERPDRSAEQCSRADEQIALDPFDVRPGRHDQDRLPVEIGEVTIEEQSHFAGVGRPGQQRQGHRPILVPRSDGSAYAAGRETGKEREKRGQSSGTGRPVPEARSGCYGLGLATAASGRAPGHARRARIAEIGFFCAAPSIGKGQAHRRALSFIHFPAALVTDENGLSCQFDPPTSRVSILKSNGTRPENGSWDSPSNAQLSTGFLVPSTRRMQVPAEMATRRRSGPGIRRLRRGRGFSSQSKQAGGARPALRRGPPGRLRQSPREHLDDRRPRRGRDRPGAARGGAAGARPRRDRPSSSTSPGSTSRSSGGGRPRTRSCTRRPRRSARRASA